MQIEQASQTDGKSSGQGGSLGDERPRRGPFGLFYGWWMVLIAAGAQFLSGGFYNQGLSVYFLPISRDLGFSRAALSLAFTLKTLEGGLDGPLVGYLVDRLGPRFMMRAGGLLAGLGFIFLAFTHDYLSFMLVFLGLVVLGFSSGVSLPLGSVINNWFARQRALAVTLGQVGAEVGGAILTPLVALVVLGVGWREAAMLSGVVLLVVFPCLSWFLKPTPESVGLTPDGTLAPAGPQGDGGGPHGGRYIAPEVDFTPREAVRTLAFWHLSLAVGIRQFSKQALMVHLVPLLVWKGFDEPTAALFVGLFALMQVPLRIGAAWLADNWSMTKVPALSALAGAGAAGVLLLGEDAWLGTGLLFVFLFALGETGNSPAWAVVGNFFGRTSYATVRGSVGFFQSLISLPAPVLAGWLYDTTQSYEVALLPIIGFYMAAFVLYWMLRRPGRQARVAQAEYHPPA
ncbi:MAG: MFS transporter [Chloroflexi bacterium]|nr:MFS transporter [Chloroflexota bacterium]